MSNWNMKNKILSGELYDLTATSRLNKTGEQKIKTSLLHGISESIEKYDQELEYMTNDTNDDKFLKRMDRYSILQLCMKIDTELQNDIREEILKNNLNTNFLSKLFTFICNYINGGNGMSQFEEQPLIIILAGGNVTTIFVNILNCIFFEKVSDLNDPDKFFEDFFIKNFFTDISEESKNELKKIVVGLRYIFNNVTDTRYDSNKKQLQVLVKDTTPKFSDLDYNIVPNQEEILNKLFLMGGVVSRSRSRSPETTSPLPRKLRSRKSIAEKKAKEQADAKAKEKADAKIAAEKEATRKAKAEATRKAKAEASRKAKAEATRKAKAEASRKAKAEATREAKAEASRKAKAEATKRQRIKSPTTSQDLSQKEIKHKNKKIDSDQSGILLVRIKSANPYKNITEKTKIPSETKAILLKLNNYYSERIENCSAEDIKYLPPISKLSQPQLFRESYLTNEKITDNCKKYLKKLQEQKKLINHLTDINITKVVEYVSGSSSDNMVKLSKFIEFLHNMCKKQNNFIKEYLDKSSLKYISVADVLDNFNSLNNITDRNKPLAKLCCALALNFLEDPDIKQIIKNITNYFEDCQKISGNYQPINVAYNLQHLINRLNYSTDILLDSQKTNIIPDNSKITTNLIQPDPIKYDIQNMSEEDILKDLKEFDKFFFDEDLDIITKGIEKLNLGHGINRTRKKRKRRRRKRRKSIKK